MNNNLFCVKFAAIIRLSMSINRTDASVNAEICFRCFTFFWIFCYYKTRWRVCTMSLINYMLELCLFTFNPFMYHMQTDFFFSLFIYLSTRFLIFALKIKRTQAQAHMHSSHIYTWFFFQQNYIRRRCELFVLTVLITVHSINFYDKFLPQDYEHCI